MTKGKICVLASGGDAPSMNACIEAIYLNATANNLQLYAAINGYEGLVDNKVVQVSSFMARGISGKSGCTFKCGRSKRFLEKDGFASAMATIKKYAFDAVIVLGGNGSFNGAGRLKSAGAHILFIPATIDNDVDYTKNSLGFASAVNCAVRLVDNLKATMETTSRDFIVQIMGRSCNQLTARVGTATLADVIDMNGQRHTPEQIADVFKKNRAMGKESNFAIIQEKIGGDQTKEMLGGVELTNQIRKFADDNNVCFTTLGYLQRGAEPSAYDRFLATLYGDSAVKCVLDKRFGVALSVSNDKVVYIDLPKAPIPS
ncbi:MAG: 6-phosphofructokinase [Christensenellaceae bacterium]|jgi:6-phosphofructokinase 1|nr:6-phosphofructokinase [Christensenellaceae bacterium]